MGLTCVTKETHKNLTKFYSETYIETECVEGSIQVVGKGDRMQRFVQNSDWTGNGILVNATTAVRVQ
jgi:hypothetical protein